MFWGAVLVGLAAGCGGTGESLNTSSTKDTMMDKGIVYIVPGVQGKASRYTNMRTGLQGSGVKYAIKILPWRSQIAGIGNSADSMAGLDDRQWGQKIAREIADYQQAYPGRPVYLIGERDGCVAAVLTAQSLASMGGKPVEGIILLDAGMATNADLSAAVDQSRKGLVNFYNLTDMALLGIGSEIASNPDASYDDSARRLGFSSGDPKVFQVQVTQSMVNTFDNPRYISRTAAFTSQYIAPWILSEQWPAVTGWWKE